MWELIAIIRSRLAKSKILQLFDWLKFFEGIVTIIFGLTFVIRFFLNWSLPKRSDVN
jgi:hypothetical protein